MATFAARRLTAMNANLRTVLAIELLAAAQGIDFHAPLATSPVLREVHARVRERVPFLAEDRYFAPDIAAAERLVEAPEFAAFAGPVLA
jgi:histidine ammonia-lyase